MNVRKPADYSAMFTALDKLVAATLPQMELYCEIGRLVSGRPEKGAAVAAAEYLSATYPDAAGFSPRNLRRMREFYRAYESIPEVLAQAMTIGWTQNVLILEAELTAQERAWYIRAVRRLEWSKLELQQQIDAGAHMENTLDFESEPCYTEEKSDHAEEPDEVSGVEGAGPGYRCCHQRRGDRRSSRSLGPPQAGRIRHSLQGNVGPPAHPHRLRRLQPTDRRTRRSPSCERILEPSPTPIPNRYLSLVAMARTVCRTP